MNMILKTPYLKKIKAYTMPLVSTHDDFRQSPHYHKKFSGQGLAASVVCMYVIPSRFGNAVQPRASAKVYSIFVCLRLSYRTTCASSYILGLYVQCEAIYSFL